MNRKNSSICSSSQMSTRSSFDNLSMSQSASSVTPAGAADLDLDPELPDAARLARSRYFLMTDNPKGKVLGCGDKIDLMPENDQFVIRIYNRDFNNNGKLKDYVELTIEDFSNIYSHKSEIEKKIYEVRSRQMIFNLDNLKVTVGPGFPGYNSKPTVEIEKLNVQKSSMYVETFTKMMNYSPAINDEFSQFKIRQDEKVRLVNEVLNTLAYLRNDSRPNGVIRQPNVRRRSGIFTTCDKLLEQAKSML